MLNKIKCFDIFDSDIYFIIFTLNDHDHYHNIVLFDVSCSYAILIYLDETIDGWVDE